MKLMKLAAIRPLLPALVGYGFVIASGTSFEIRCFSSLEPALRLVGMIAITLAQSSTYIALSIASRQRDVRLEKLPLWRVVGAGLVGLLVTCLNAQGPFAWQLTAAATGAALQGFMLAVLTMLWFELYAELIERELLLALALSHAVSAVLSFCLANLGASGAVEVVLCALPALSLACYKKARDNHTPLPANPEETARWTFPYRPVCFIAIFTFANNIMHELVPVEMVGVAFLGVVAAALSVAFLALFAFKRFTLATLRTAALPLLLASILALFPLRADLAASTLASGAYVLLSIFTVALLCKISLRYAIPALWLLGPTEAAGDLAGCLGEVTAMALPKDLPPAGGTALLVTVCVPLLAWAYMAFATSDDTSGTWGVTAGPSAAPDQGASVQTCAALARSFGLTRREEDVLALLLEGASATDIAAGLVVSEATARSHIQHIYQKLSVHSKDELLRFCGEREG